MRFLQVGKQLSTWDPAWACLPGPAIWVYDHCFDIFLIGNKRTVRVNLHLFAVAHHESCAIQVSIISIENAFSIKMRS